MKTFIFISIIGFALLFAGFCMVKKGYLAVMGTLLLVAINSFHK